ncbi:histidine kinase [Paenibacillus yanchengensis]|uniref:histidine kinase n=1 Tax=Paenibacillus yanchengensis TaxID=2035833 RepID=A0ABW4YPR4_9BACL
MFIKIIRSNKWEWIGLFMLGSAIMLGAMYWIWNGVSTHRSIGEARIYSVLLFLLLSGIYGYYLAQRFSGRLETLHLALKQMANGNYEVRIPEEGNQSVIRLYRQFNELATSMEEKMIQLQRLGETLVMEQVASNEEAVLEERKRLARDLHDSVSQQLFAIHMCASSLSRLQQTDFEKAEEVMEQLVTMSTLAQKQMRNFIAQLRPMELEGRTLYEALDKWFPDYCRQNNLQGELDWRISDPISEAKEHQLFLIIQEAMANIVKHARADHCKLTISDSKRQMVVYLSDNGVGFNVDKVERGSYGLSTMQERAIKLGGDAEVISKIGSGTRVKIMIPKL